VKFETSAFKRARYTKTSRQSTGHAAPCGGSHRDHGRPPHAQSRSLTKTQHAKHFTRSTITYLHSLPDIYILI